MRRTAYLFLFPFDLECADDGAMPMTVKTREGTATFFPPFRNDSQPDRILRQIKTSFIPYPAGTVPPHRRTPQINDVPYRPRRDVPFILANALRVDMAEGRNADLVVQHFLSYCRMATRQWWISRNHSDEESYLRNSMPVGKRGEALNEMHMQARLPPAPIEVRLLTNVLFANVCRALQYQQGPPLSAEFLFDAIWFFTSGDHRRCIMDAATACEVLIREQALSLANKRDVDHSTVHRTFRGTNFLNHIANGLEAIYGRSYYSDFSDDRMRITRLWSARGNVAHGKPPLIPSGNQSRIADANDIHDMLHAVINLFNWHRQREIEFGGQLLEAFQY